MISDFRGASGERERATLVLPQRQGMGRDCGTAQADGVSALRSGWRVDSARLFARLRRRRLPAQNHSRQTGGSFAATAIDALAVVAPFSVWLADKIRRLSHHRTHAAANSCNAPVAGSITAACRVVAALPAEVTGPGNASGDDSTSAKASDTAALGLFSAARSARGIARPATQVVEHLLAAFPDANCPITDFNIRRGPSSCKSVPLTLSRRRHDRRPKQLHPQPLSRGEVRSIVTEFSARRRLPLADATSVESARQRKMS